MHELMFYLEVSNVTEKVLTNVLELLSLSRDRVGGERVAARAREGRRRVKQ